MSLVLWQAITVTGAIGSGMVCYLLPIINHFALYFGWAKFSREALPAAAEQDTDCDGELKTDADSLRINKEAAMGDAAQLEPAYIYPTFAEDGFGIVKLMLNVGLPFIVVSVGLFVSIATLVTL